MFPWSQLQFELSQTKELLLLFLEINRNGNMGIYNFLSEILILSFFELIQSPKMVPWILEAALSNLGLKWTWLVNTVSWSKNPGSVLVAFWNEKHTISVLQAAPEKHARPLMLSIYICMWTACRPFYEDRWIAGLQEGPSDLSTWTTYPYSP